MERKKIKILQTIRQGKIGGGETHVLDLVDNLDKSLFECVVLSFTFGPMVDKMRDRGIKTFVIETEKPFNFLIWNKVKALLAAESIDIVHAHGSRANSNVFFATRALNIPLIYTVHGWSFHPDQKILIKKLRILSEKFLVKKADLTICVSNSNLKDGVHFFPMKHAKVIKCGINFHKFDPSGTYDDIRLKLGLDNETILVGYVVRMTKQKDPLTLIKAIALIPENLNIKFLFVGDGELKEDAVKLTSLLKLSNKIIFKDFTDDVPAILNAIDIYCLPSLWEGLPLGMLEAMAMKKPVVVSAIDGAIEVINNHDNGFLISPKNPKELAKVLINLSLNKDLRTTVGQNGYKTILNNFNIDKMIKSIQNCYIEILN